MTVLRRDWVYGDDLSAVGKHYGPGPHPSGSPQSDHAGDQVAEIPSPQWSELQGRFISEVPVSFLESIREYRRLGDNPITTVARSQEKVDEIAASVLEEGWRDPVIIDLYFDDSGRVLAQLAEGNHRLEVAKKLGLTTLPAKVIVRSSEFYPRSEISAPPVDVTDLVKVTIDETHPPGLKGEYWTPDDFFDFTKLTKHYGPGDHPSGTSQDVHGDWAEGESGPAPSMADTSIHGSSLVAPAYGHELVEPRPAMHEGRPATVSMEHLKESTQKKIIDRLAKYGLTPEQGLANLNKIYDSAVNRYEEMDTDQGVHKERVPDWMDDIPTEVVMALTDIDPAALPGKAQALVEHGLLDPADVSLSEDEIWLKAEEAIQARFNESDYGGEARKQQSEDLRFLRDTMGTGGWMWAENAGSMLREYDRFYRRWHEVIYDIARDPKYQAGLEELGLGFSEVVAGAAAMSPQLEAGQNLQYIEDVVAMAVENPELSASVIDKVNAERLIEQRAAARKAESETNLERKAWYQQMVEDLDHPLEVGDHLLDAGSARLIARAAHWHRQEAPDTSIPYLDQSRRGVGFQTAAGFGPFATAWEIISGERSVDDALKGVKVRSFHNNILDPEDYLQRLDVTIDFQLMDSYFLAKGSGAARTARVGGRTVTIDPRNPGSDFTSFTEYGVKYGIRPIVADAVRSVWTERGSETGAVAPLEIQEIIWAEWKRGQAEGIWGDREIKRVT